MHRPWPLDPLAAALRAALLMLLAGNAYAQYAVSQSPPMSLTPPTNIVMMLDDSGSMQWAYVPDAYGACTGTRRFNAGTFNALAYNPSAVYVPPSVITSSLYNPANAITDPITGTTTLSTSYNAAYIDGFNPGLGTLNLANGYQPTASYQAGGTQQTYSPHPAQDLTVIGVTSASGGGGGGVNPNCGSSVYGGANGNAGAGNQFGPYSGSSTIVPAAAYYYQYNASAFNSSNPPALCGTLTPTNPNANDDACYQYMPAALAPSVVDPATNKTISGTQNFANWYSFYRNRHLMIASATATAMYDQKLVGARVAWRALNSCQDMVLANGKFTCAGWDGQGVDNRLRYFNDNSPATGQVGQRAAFYEWLAHVPASQSTPTRTTWTYIGDYFSKGPNTAFSATSLGANGPYGLNPNEPNTDPSSGEVACVNNYNITLTDGQWNPPNDTQSSYFGTADALATTLPDGQAYTPSTSPPTAIFSNDHSSTGTPYANSDTLSDVAFHYWATNLRPDLSGSVGAVKAYYVPGTPNPPSTYDYWNPQNDPATWPHLEQMTIGIGMTSTMNVPNLCWWGNGTYNGAPYNQYSLSSTTTNPGATSCTPGIYPNSGYQNLWWGNAAWPAINDNAMQGDTGKAYDLWHAALNSRGMAFSAESAPELVAAMEAVINRATVTLNAQSAVATSSTSLSTTTAAYLASYTSSDWHGTLAAYGFTNGVINTGSNWIWDSDAVSAGGSGALFSAVTTPTNRSIFTAADTSAGQASTAPWELSSADANFMISWNNLTGGNVSPAAAQASLNLLDWVRGGQSNEQPAGAYRTRKASVLGDIVDSAPVFTYRENFGYAALPEGMSATPNYSTFLSGTKNNGAGTIYQNTGMIYVGANDGMLHGFDAKSGNEVFAYVPHNVIHNLPALANPSYSHQFYVDQTPYVGDACVGTGPTACSWATVLVGTTGAGGQGVFAIDVTSPSTMETGSGAKGHLLWDLDGLGAPTTNPTNPSGNPDLGYPIGKPMVARLNDGTWAAIFGNGYLSADGCAVLFIVRLKTGAVSRIGTGGHAPGSSCVTANPNASNGLGPVTLFDADGNMTTDYVYAGDLAGNLWKFDLTAGNVPAPGSDIVGGTQLFAASSSGCFAPAPPLPGTNTCQPITSAPALGPALPGMTGTMVYFGTGRLFAIGDATNATPQTFYAILDQNTKVSSSQLVQLTAHDSGTTRTVTGNDVTSTSMGWYMNLPDPGERVTVSPVLIGGYVVFATEVPKSSPCVSGATGWIMAVSASSKAVGGSNLSFFAANPLGTAGVQATVGAVEGITVLSNPGAGGDTLLVGGTKGVQNVQTNITAPKGRISWHELVR